MKILVLTPDWKLPWQKLVPDYLKIRGHTVGVAIHGVNGFDPDVVLHMWSNGYTRPEHFPNAKNIFYMRRYEFFEPEWRKIDWNKVDHMVFVNSFIKKAVEDWFKENDINIPTSLIYNSVDTKKWTFKERTFNNNIGMVCFIHPKKNLTLAAQVLAALPSKYSLHLAGACQDWALLEYINHICHESHRKFYWYGRLKFEMLDSWWDMMDCCLSVSMSEGNPNNVIEAMAKGIKPVVHNWPGAIDQFPEECVFNTVESACQIIQNDDYDSSKYRQWAEDRYSLKNYDQMYDIIKQVTAQ
jgi:glycosyltransferase involved in cell wall biosynthesis